MKDFKLYLALGTIEILYDKKLNTIMLILRDEIGRAMTVELSEREALAVAKVLLETV